MLHKMILLVVLLLAPFYQTAGDDDPLVSYPQQPQAQWTWFGGKLEYSFNHPCLDSSFYIYTGDGPNGELLGSGKAFFSYDRVNWYFAIYLDRPLREGETITVYAECAENQVVQDTFVVLPFQSWPRPLDWHMVPGMYDQPIEGDTMIRGRLTPSICAGALVSVSLGAKPSGTRLGTSTVEVDGSFRVYLSRSLREGELITFYAECAKGPRGVFVWDTLAVSPAPPQIPEPGTILLVGGGLGALASWIRLHQRKP